MKGLDKREEEAALIKSTITRLGKSQRFDTADEDGGKH